MRTDKENGLGIQQPGGQESASVLGKITMHATLSDVSGLEFR